MASEAEPHDTLYYPPDTMRGPPDSTSYPSDSVRYPPDSMRYLPESMRYSEVNDYPPPTQSSQQMIDQMHSRSRSKGGVSKIDHELGEVFDIKFKARGNTPNNRNSPFQPTLKNLFKFGMKDKAKDLLLNPREIDFRCTM